MVKSSKNEFACEPLNDWIQDEKHDNMNEVIHSVPISNPRKEVMWDAQDFLLTKHSLKNGVMDQHMFTLSYKDDKRSILEFECHLDLQVYSSNNVCRKRMENEDKN